MKRRVCVLALITVLLVAWSAHASPHRRKTIDFDALEKAWEHGDDDRELRSPADEQFDRLNSASEDDARAMGPQMVFVTLKPPHEPLEDLASRWKELLWNGGVDANIYEIEKDKVLVGVQKGSDVQDLRRFLDQQLEIQEYEWNGQRFRQGESKVKGKKKKKKKHKEKKKRGKMKTDLARHTTSSTTTQASQREVATDTTADHVDL
ncbi:hypothetical protein PINS_up015157 [Pythium insidiosum]|nr:hypothetical protein PINS_up015157 [Pythium insidiosum]